MSKNTKTVLLYMGEDLVDLLVLNQLVPEMVKLGLDPVIVFPKKPKLFPVRIALFLISVWVISERLRRSLTLGRRRQPAYFYLPTQQCFLKERQLASIRSLS